MLHSDLFLLFLFNVELFEQLMEHGKEITWLKSTFLHVFAKLGFGYVARISLANFGDIFAFQNLISVLVIPSAFLIVGETLVRFLN